MLHNSFAPTCKSAPRGWPCPCSTPSTAVLFLCDCFLWELSFLSPTMPWGCIGHLFLICKRKTELKTGCVWGGRSSTTCSQHLYWLRKVKFFPVINSWKFRQSPIYTLAFPQEQACHQKDARDGTRLGEGGGNPPNLGAASQNQGHAPLSGPGQPQQGGQAAGLLFWKVQEAARDSLSH